MKLYLIFNRTIAVQALADLFTSRKAFLFLAVFSAVFPLTLRSEEGRSEMPIFSLEECVEQAIVAYPSLQVHAFGAQAAAEEVVIARSARYPTLSCFAYGARWKKRFFFPSLATAVPIPKLIGPLSEWQAGISSEYLVADGGGRTAAIRSAESLRRAANKQCSSEREMVAHRTVMAFLDQLTAEALLEARKNDVARAANYLQIAEERYRVGEVPRVDLWMHRAFLADAEREETDGALFLKECRELLRTLLALSPFAVWQLDGTPYHLLPVQQFRDDVSAREIAYQQRYDLQSALAESRAACHQVTLAKSECRGALRAVSYCSLHDDRVLPKDCEWSVALQFNLPLFRGGAIQAGIERAKNIFSQKQAEVATLQLEIAQQVAIARAQEEASRVQATAAYQQQLFAEEALRSALTRYEEGASTISELFDAHVAASEANIHCISSQFAVWKYHFHLLWTMGILMTYFEETHSIAEGGSHSLYR